MHDARANGGREPLTGSGHADRVRFGPFVFDRRSPALWRDGDEIELPLRSLLVLDLLLRCRARVVPRERLIDEVWQGGFVTDSSLTEAVSRLRQALGDGARAPRYIQTVHGRGYKFVAPFDRPVDVHSPRPRVATPLDTSPVVRAPARSIPRLSGPGAAIAAALFLAVLVSLAVLARKTATPGPREAEPPGVGAAGTVAVKPKPGARPLFRLAEVTMSGEPRARYGFPPLPLDDLSVDPVGGRLAFAMTSAEGSDIWMLQPSQGMLKRIASGGHFSDPVWTRDGRGLAVAHNRGGSIDLLYGEPESGSRMEVLLEAPYDQFPESWSADGRSLVYSERHPDTGFDLWLLGRHDDGRWRRELLVRTRRHEAFGAISPDGRRVAYVSKGDGPPAVFVLDRHREQPPARVSRHGGRYPFWSADGERLHYVDDDAVWTLDAAELAADAPPSARRATTVAGVFLAAPASAEDGFVVAVRHDPR